MVRLLGLVAVGTLLESGEAHRQVGPALALASMGDPALRHAQGMDDSFCRRVPTSGRDPDVAPADD